MIIDLILIHKGEKVKDLSFFFSRFLPHISVRTYSIYIYIYIYIIYIYYIYYIYILYIYIYICL